MQGELKACSLVSKSARVIVQSAAALAVAVVILPTAPRDALAQINCSNPVGIPSLPGAFNAWGPAAVCATAGSLVGLGASFNAANTMFLTHTGPFVGSPPGPPNSGAGGVWVRGIGGNVENTATGTFTAPGFGLPAVSVNGETSTDYAGFQGGVDIARLNMGASGWNGHIGLTGGFMSSQASAKIGTGSLDGEVPFFGVYGVLTHSSGFFSDLLVRWDWYSNDITNANVGLNNTSFNADGFSVTGNAGYRFSLPANWFVEPSGGLVWSRVSIDPLAVPGGGPFGVPAGTITFSDVDSLLGRVGVRVGTTFATPTVALQPFIAANLWHEFEDDSLASFVCTVCGGFALNVATSRVGTYGQYGAGLVGQVLNTGWLGYLRVDYRKGDNIDGWGLNGGLRYQWQDAAAAPSPALIRK
jgi:outer membrane autotransporter protein